MEPMDTSEANDTTTNQFVSVRLVDVLPCNLRRECKFLRSAVDMTLDSRSLLLFLRCYGYLMHDRTDKIKFLRGSPDTRVLSAADALDSCRGIDDFKNAMREHVSQIGVFLTDEVASAFLEESEDEREEEDEMTSSCKKRRRLDASGRACTVNRAADESRPSNSELLMFARDALMHVLRFLDDGAQLRRFVNTNEYCRLLMAVDPDNAQELVRTVWRERDATSDLDRCLSAVLCDAIASTGMDVYHTLSFVLRASLVLTFLLSNCGARPNAVNVDQTIVVNVDKSSFELLDQPTRQLMTEYFLHFNDIDGERFIATVMVAMIRMYFLHNVTWPQKLALNHEATIDLEAIRSELTNRLCVANRSKHITGSVHDFPWIRVITSRKNGRRTRKNRRQESNEEESRIYVKSELVPTLFERLGRYAETTGTTTTTSTTATHRGAPSIECRLRGVDESTKRAYDEFGAQLKQCAKSIAPNVRTRDIGLRPRDFVLHPAYRSRIAGTAATDSEQKLLLEQERDEMEMDVTNLLVFSVLSLLRRDVNSKTYDGANPEKPLEYDATCESYCVMMQHAMTHMVQSKTTVSQLESFFAFMVNMFNTKIGVITLQQLSSIMMEIYKMFPGIKTETDQSRTVAVH